MRIRSLSLSVIVLLSMSSLARADAIEEGIESGPPIPLDDIHAFFADWLERRMLFDHIACCSGLIRYNGSISSQH